MKENAALVLIALSIVVVSVTKTAKHKEKLPIDTGELSFVRVKHVLPQKHTVEIKGFKFSIADLEVQHGDTVRWVNKDIVPHTATANDNSWDSDLLNENEAWELVIDEDNSGSYFCKYHPTMKGNITIQQ